MRDAAQNHAETGGALALPGAGMDDDEALLAFLRRHDLVARGLLLGHLLRVPGGVFCRIGRFRCGHGPFRCLTRGALMPQVRRRWFLS